CLIPLLLSNSGINRNNSPLQRGAICRKESKYKEVEVKNVKKSRKKCVT
ncbi:MAG: hypothetical protein ACI9FD_002841, partial [Gammaproteobacteria bacterium]